MSKLQERVFRCQAKRDERVDLVVGARHVGAAPLHLTLWQSEAMGVLPRDQVSWVRFKSSLSIGLSCANTTSRTISKVDILG
jgi:hypothetical protein